jgi:meso-butanediol dehydrogenase/(S,S)-butanediol dehydrogenase/diacetyl reductase
MRLQDKVCVVTGAAQGIGRAVAERLASEGARVVVADIDEAKAVATATALEAAGGSSFGAGVDVSDRAAVKSLVQDVVQRLGHVDVWFNNAGLNKPMPFLDVSEENWNLILRVNALGVLIGTQEAARQMIEQGRGGKIVNTASVAARQGYPDFAPYCASKFAVVALTQAAARALAPHKITVNGFSPGVVDTPLWERLDADLIAIGASARPGEAMEAFSSGILMGRPAQGAEIAGTAAFLASSDSDYITGQIVAVDGGMVLV